MMQLISATPSPYARKVRIALAEKGLPFELITEVPWDNATVTPRYNPLEKLPILILDDGTTVYESSFILEWLELDPAYAYDADKGLKALAHGAATNGGGALLSSERGKFAGMESIDFTFEKQGLDGRGLAFVAGHRVYALAGLGPEASTQATFQRFVDSLHLK